MAGRIVIVDDEQDFLDSVKRGLATAGYKDVQLENDPLKAAEFFRTGEDYDVALIDVTMPGMNGVELLETIKCYSPGTECIMLSAVNEASVAVDCIKKGAYDYLVKPVSRDDLVLKINRAAERKRLLDLLSIRKEEFARGLIHKDAFRCIITQSARIMELLKEAELHAASDVPVLITGESGTGKELLARAIHLASPRAKLPFMPVNMASVAGTLFDAEFFGHTRGAFTGADKDRMGYLEHAAHGTLFLDEIGNLPLDLQGKLLRVLQEREFVKLGTGRIQKTDVRFIAATNEDLNKLMAKGGFRKDLYFRLRGAWLHLPPLRERREDIPLLVTEFLGAAQTGTKPAGIDEQALAILVEYDYPGNIRELRSILQVAVNLARGRTISPGFLPDFLKEQRPIKPAALPHLDEDGPIELAEVEKAHILRVYLQARRNKSKASRLLGIGMNTLRRKLESYGVA